MLFRYSESHFIDFFCIFLQYRDEADFSYEFPRIDHAIGVSFILSEEVIYGFDVGDAFL